MVFHSAVKPVEETFLPALGTTVCKEPDAPVVTSITFELEEAPEPLVARTLNLYVVAATRPEM